jgi:hypothetical protein
MTPDQLKQIITGEGKMENTVVKMQEPALSLEPRGLLEKAIASGAGIELIERLMAMQERWEATQARKAFNAAIAAFKKSPPAILKNVEVGYGKTSYKHEDLAELLAAVDPALAEHGLWARFKIKTDLAPLVDNKPSGTLVTVTCVIGHTDGYSESDSVLAAAPDTSGSKNAVQAIGSTVSYLQRYTLKAALGLAAARDDDGRTAANAAKSNYGKISEEQVDTVNTALFGQTDKLKKRLLELAHVENVNDIATIHFDSVMQFIKKYGEEAK